MDSRAVKDYRLHRYSAYQCNRNLPTYQKYAPLFQRFRKAHGNFESNLVMQGLKIRRRGVTVFGGRVVIKKTSMHRGGLFSSDYHENIKFNRDKHLHLYNRVLVWASHR